MFSLRKLQRNFNSSTYESCVIINKDNINDHNDETNLSRFERNEFQCVVLSLVLFSYERLRKTRCVQSSHQRIWEEQGHQVVTIIIVISAHPNLVPNFSSVRVRINFKCIESLLDLHHSVRLDETVDNVLVVSRKGLVQLLSASLDDFRCKRFDPKIVQLLPRNL